MISLLFKLTRKITQQSIQPIYTPIAKLYFFLNGVKIVSGIKVSGFIKVFVTRRGSIKIGENLKINSGNRFNVIGRQQKTTFWVEGKLIIGDNVGMSSTAIICNHEIEIGNHVTLGGNTVIYDTDFHSLDPLTRREQTNDKIKSNWGKVKIEDNVFIGAHSTILKGVIIGENSVIGSCSVVSKNIPSNEIWAGNPIKFIKKI